MYKYVPCMHNVFMYGYSTYVLFHKRVNFFIKVCMHVCMYVCMYATYGVTYVNIYFINTLTYVCKYVCMHEVCMMYVCMYICVCMIYVSMYSMYLCICMYALTSVFRLEIRQLMQDAYMSICERPGAAQENLPLHRHFVNTPRLIHAVSSVKLDSSYSK